MTITFRAGDEPATSRREYWQHVAVTALGPLDVLVNGEIDSADRLVVGELGTVRVGQLSAHQSGGARRMARHIRQEDPDFCKIDILARGGGAVVQDGREAVLRPGDFTFVDLSRPAHWRMSPMQIVAVSFPRALLPLRPNDLTRMTGTTISGDRGAGALVSSLALRLPDCLDDPEVAAGNRLGTAVLDLLIAGMAARLDVGGDRPARDTAACPAAANPRVGRTTPR